MNPSLQTRYRKTASVTLPFATRMDGLSLATALRCASTARAALQMLLFSRQRSARRFHDATSRHTALTMSDPPARFLLPYLPAPNLP
jgi:hypothetical protein